MVDAPSYSEVAVLIGEPIEQNQNTFEYAFNKKGFGTVRIVGDFLDFEKEVTDSVFDLIVCDSGMAGGDLFDLIHQVRHGRCHPQNAFSIIVCLSPKPSQDQLKGSLVAGFDKVLFGPEGQRNLFKTIGELMKTRGSFIVKSDYVGPRRLGMDEPFPGQPLPQELKTPNPLKLMTSGKVSRGEVTSVIDATTDDMNRIKIESHVERLLWGVYKIGILSKSQGADNDVKEVAQLTYVAADDLARRLEGLHQEASRDICKALGRVARSIAAPEAEISLRDLALLPNLGEAVDQAFNASDEVKSQVSEMMTSLKEKV